MDYPGNPNPSYDNNFDHSFNPFEFELSDYLQLGDCFGDEPRMETTTAASSSSSQRAIEGVNAHGVFPAAESDNANNIDYVNRPKKKKIERGHRVAFRTQSEQEVMDDGYKWRKYGKKSVKDSPNPRNYYRCSFGGCQVKKRVERDREDSSYVITTYEGFHSHDAHPSTTATSNIDYSSPFHYYCYADHHQHQQLSPDLLALPASNCSNSSSSS